MRKFLVFPLVVGLVVAAASSSNAQTGQGCGGTVQSYQRYSYQPAASQTAPNPTVVQGNLMNGPMTMSSPVGEQFSQVGSQQLGGPQVYRRYSYMPQASYGNTTGHKKNLWEYAKGDPRRYRP